jgi:pimeloyl-ACP methyl ester carboxylesterase
MQFAGRVHKSKYLMVNVTSSSLFSGSAEYPIFVDHLRPSKRRYPFPVVMVHGACNTGACFLATPDGRPGWAYNFAEEGLDTFVIDWPGHGRSPMRTNFLEMSTRDVRDSISCLLGQIGPAVLVAHSAGGPIAWSLAEKHSDLVVAIVGISPGPPSNLLEAMPADSEALHRPRDGVDTGLPIFAPEGELFWVDLAFVEDSWFAGSQAPADAAEKFFRSVVPESPTVINERFNIAGSGLSVREPSLVGDRPILIVTGDSDPRHPRSFDQRTAELFKAEFVWLPTRGIQGNGHMLMADSNSRVVAQLVVNWLKEQALNSRAAIPQQND